MRESPRMRRQNGNGHVARGAGAWAWYAQGRMFCSIESAGIYLSRNGQRWGFSGALVIGYDIVPVG